MMTILVVDDHADLRRLIRWALELLEKPYELVEASSGSTALAKAQELKPDLLLLDVMMPGGVDGLEVCRQIKADRDLSDTYVILLSARGQAQDIQTGLAAGADAYMVKPFSPARLLEVVEGILAGKVAEDVKK